MIPDLKPDVAVGYTSKAQRTRVITESWAASNLYCPSCSSNRIHAHRPGKRVEDFLCPTCDRRTQLKAKRNSMGRKVANSAYDPKMQAIKNNRAPDYAFMAFDPDDWIVHDLFLVPGHFMTPSVVEKRKPLSSSARRSGWVGSNILLDRIPKAGRVPLIIERSVVPQFEVRAQFRRAAFVERLQPSERGWVGDVWNCIDRLDLESGDEFDLSDIYAFEDDLAHLHPDNQHVRAKIRQQLQRLRDENVITFLGRGRYRLRSPQH